ncbi:MAG: substrate-binding domain-containing protein [Pirellulaceae bacterium]
MKKSAGLLFILFLSIQVGCSQPVVENNPEAAGGLYTILGTRTDNFDFGKAKSDAEDVLTAHPDIDCMVGLFAYNPPYILEALKGVDKIGRVTLIGFDEADETLQAIKDGNCYGTVVQDPYMYGYRSVELLSQLVAGEKDVLPEGGVLNIPARKITRDNVDEFWDQLKQRVADGEAAAKAAVKKNDRPTVAFVSNGIASFWVIAEAGARKAGEDFNVNVEVRMPPDGLADQKRMLEELLVAGVDGIAVSPIDPDNQLELLNSVGESTILITQDSDAPNSNRLAYIGMNNYDAGIMCGELIHESIPAGGDVMIFVGRLEQLNAKLRRQGLIDYLLGREPDDTRFDPPGKVLQGSPATAN